MKRWLVALALILGASGCTGIRPPRPTGATTPGTIYLDATERALLFRQPAHTAGDGGFQNLLVGLQQRIDPTSGRIDLTAADLERIPRYAFDYRNGGWEDRLIGIFRRHLGSRLGR